MIGILILCVEQRLRDRREQQRAVERGGPGVQTRVAPQTEKQEGEGKIRNLDKTC